MNTAYTARLPTTPTCAVTFSVEAIRRGKTLDAEHVKVTGFHRKHAIRVLKKSPGPAASAPRKRARIYNEAVREALIILWEAAAVLNKLYTSARLFVNFFQPSFKLLSKIREGAKVIKKYHPPATPCERLLDREDVSDECKEQLRQTLAALDPVRLLSEIREAQRVLAQLEVGVVNADTAQSTPELSGFVASLSTVWRDGEVRPTHRKRSHRATNLSYSRGPI